jgi:hypothetical protein
MHESHDKYSIGGFTLADTGRTEIAASASDCGAGLARERLVMRVRLVGLEIKLIQNQ